MKVLCIGHASYDITMPLDEYPKENVKYRVSEKIECGGGPAATAAFTLGSFGVPTVFKGVVGNDIFGRRIKEEFNSVGVDISYMETNNKVDTTLSFIILNEKDNTRTIFNYASTYLMLKNNEYDFEPDFILIDGHNYRGSKIALEKFPNATKIIDAGRNTKEVVELSKMVDYLVCSKDFAESYTGMSVNYEDIHSLVDIYNTLENDFKNTVVITLEDKGCFTKCETGYKLIKTLKVDAKDTTGAGDIFHGAFVYALTKNMDLISSCKFANITAALSTKNIGTRYSVPSLELVESIFNLNK